MGSSYSTPLTVTFDLSNPSSPAKCPICEREFTLREAYEHAMSHQAPAPDAPLRILKHAGEYDVNI